MRKLALSVAAAALLGISGAVAETDGAFVGVQLGYGGAKVTQEYSSPTESFEDSMSGSAFRFGILGGYKQFFTENFGARYYGVVEFGTKYKFDATDDETGTTSTVKSNTYNINVNADALYNFVSQSDLDVGVFGGLSLGYANHTLKGDGGDGESLKPAGFDLGINFGFRANLAQQHGIELYSRFGLLEQKKEKDNDYGTKATTKAKQPYAVGLRYVFSF